MARLRRDPRRCSDTKCGCATEIPPGLHVIPHNKCLWQRWFPADCGDGHRNRAMNRSFLLLVAGAVAIGFAPIFVRLTSTGPIATAFWRMALAVPVLWMLVSRQNISMSIAFRSPLIWLAGLAFALDLSAWHFSIRLTSVTNATLLAKRMRHCSPTAPCCLCRFYPGFFCGERFARARSDAGCWRFWVSHC